MAVEIVAELATAHGGDVDLACDMVAAAADAGAHTVKIQSYTLAHLNRQDPQYAWLSQARLDPSATQRIIDACATHGVRFLSTPFDFESLVELRHMGQERFKVPSSLPIWIYEWDAYTQVKSWAWGQQRADWRGGTDTTHLTTIPLYPAPVEALASVPLLDGYSDHTPGTAACKHMLSKGACIIEAHFCLPGKSRVMPWDKTPQQLREIRDWADQVETMTTGIAQQFRERWNQ